MRNTLLSVFMFTLVLLSMAFTSQSSSHLQETAGYNDKKSSGLTHKEKIPAKRAKTETMHITASEKDLLSRLVHAEAKGEPFEGKVAVASVVLNRMEAKQFPDSVSDVVYEKNQFSPVSNGSIRKPADEESKRAVDEALEDPNSDALYFFNPDLTDDRWIRTRKVTEIIGDHHFAI
ncbi:cell wall hydrolase [Bacillus sp. M6-12]|uniref:cell wall hydrolase n=1 Tax=Bacillus sp. M6-12 TaxID=2054166 RepID=UPI000C769B5D|nr:cell wall hydrolase [Bacillus sp. M6-12]PLS17122.1 cell wall hydrolase [Bacillus sp. M6-12]